jgi:hypothetical protein
MSRSGYSEDLDQWDLIKWRGQVASAIRGKRGQKLLADMVAALDLMPEKALVSSELETPDGQVCALGAVGRMRGIKMQEIDPEEPEQVAAVFDIARQLAMEIAYQNDEGGPETPEHRWLRMREWASDNLLNESVA